MSPSLKIARHDTAYRKLLTIGINGEGISAKCYYCFINLIKSLYSKAGPITDVGRKFR